MKWGRIALIVGGVLVVAVGGLGVFVATYTPAQRPAPEAFRAATDPGQIERGQYLAEHVMLCGSCHGERYWTHFAGPSLSRFNGGECWTHGMDFPGELCAPNLTPHEHGLADWTDGEIARAIREGVDKDGRALAPLMPYTLYRHMSDEDLAAVVGYLRSLKPVDATYDEPEIDFPVSFFFKLAPAPLDGPVTAPKPAETAEYGAYLATVGACIECHTPVDGNHQTIAGKEGWGGQVFHGPFGVVASANITPSSAGIGGLSKEAFIQRFKDHETARTPAKVNSNSVMPWTEYAGMSERDLGALYAYLRTLPGSEEGVVTFPEAD